MVFVLDSDWLPTVLGTRQCIKIGKGNRQGISIGYSVCVMYKDREWVNFRHCATIFGTVRLFSAL